MYILHAFVYDYLIMSKLSFHFLLDITMDFSIALCKIDTGGTSSSNRLTTIFIFMVCNVFTLFELRMILQKGKSILSTLRFSMTFKTLSTYKFKHFALLLYGRMFYFSHLLQLPCNYFTASLQNFLHEMLSNFKWTKCNMKNHNQEKSTNT